MFPFGSLQSNLIAFCTVLRRDRGFRIGPGELHDAARALDIVDLSDERAVRDALRPILCATREEAAVFDRAFSEFFFPKPSGARQTGLPAVRDARREKARRRDEDVHADGRTPPERPADENGSEPVGGSIAPRAVADRDGERAALVARAAYSPLAADDADEAPVLTRVEPAWRDAARMLVRRLHVGLSRRWRPASSGRRFDLRRTLRASVQTGGETLAPRWLRRPRRTPRFVVVVDGSRSMGESARTALRVAVAIASVTMHVEVFTFSTALRRVTTDVRRAAAGEARRLGRLHHAWAGGTSIGECLGELLRRFGERLIRRDTVVIIASDGLDVGAPDALRAAMRELHRRSAGVVWLNPLLETPGYEPTAGGMRAARPYIDTFTSATDPAGLARLSRVVRVRA